MGDYIQRIILGMGVVGFVIAIIIIFTAAFETFTGPSSSEKYYLENKREIDAYNERHKDDWNGYKGCRRGSFGESDLLRANGYDPDEYRKAHGY